MQLHVWKRGPPEVAVWSSSRRVHDRAAFLISFFQVGWHSQCHWLARGFIISPVVTFWPIVLTAKQNLLHLEKSHLAQALVFRFEVEKLLGL